jgi:hypothetical protein
MKVRFHSNSLRVRLSQSEVARLSETGRVEEKITFAPGQTLAYSVESGGVDSIRATFEGSAIRVILPDHAARKWIGSDDEGIENAGATLRVLIEKDYQCLHRESEDDTDAFPNPDR